MITSRLYNSYSIENPKITKHVATKDTFTENGIKALCKRFLEDKNINADENIFQDKIKDFAKDNGGKTSNTKDIKETFFNFLNTKGITIC